MAGSFCPPETSLIILAPASSAALATVLEVVSILIKIALFSCCLIAVITGMTRFCCSSDVTGSEPGRVDSPPMSIISTPSSNICSTCISASCKPENNPPSEKLSGVTFKIPIMSGFWIWLNMFKRSYAMR